jgi:hypothetical protein
VNFADITVRATDELPGDVELGPMLDKLKNDLQHEIQRDFKLTQLPADLLTELTTFVNENMGRFRVHLVARKQSQLTERPKLVFAIRHPDHGGFGLYTWGQAMEDYGRVEDAPDIIVRVIRYMSDLYGEDFNHCMLTLHVDGTCGIPPHPDKSFSKESKGKNETASKLADVSLGATRSFMLVPNSLKANDSLEVMKEKSVATLNMSHGTSLCTQAHWNTMVKHCVPFDTTVKEPRISMVFRRVDKRFIHPGEDLERYAHQKMWKPLVNSKKAVVHLRRQPYELTGGDAPEISEEPDEEPHEDASDAD